MGGVYYANHSQWPNATWKKTCSQCNVNCENIANVKSTYVQFVTEALKYADDDGLFTS